ncbi:PEP/pyruvate-binding domain-containing protein [Flavivirga amylovorans]|uniref:PEP/pyruvate-binding domain-containing protein n=1 Tax=Flavivirga amylovorans TaxID=870486 RepID=A0ABT8X7T4_9FLAO|nr:PEP/pyruvate-binding domain-containing protein [Flavivirga amylovorans]MDO5989753.1 PEP/pyruvate-binding domain-containing protein [Flavivirga amylovorans]
MKKRVLELFILVIFSFCAQTNAQKLSPEKIKVQLEGYKNDIRGPYKIIQWFCKDGTIRGAKDPCLDTVGGIQHATYKDAVVALGKSNHIYLGQILAYTDKSDFWDDSKNHSRLKQYQLGKYLAHIDDGWVNRKGQYYRGAIQIEDEEQWGIDFYKWLLSKDEILEKNYFLVLQSLKDIPHKGDDDLSQRMRAESKVLSDQYGRFMDLRVKIHSNPEPSDIEKTMAFVNTNASKLTAAQSKKFQALIQTMQQFHQPVDVKGIAVKAKRLSITSPVKKNIQNYINNNAIGIEHNAFVSSSAELLLSIRKQITKEKSASQRMLLLDIANQLQGIVFKTSLQWQPETLKEQLEKVYALTMASAGSGSIELWEWGQVQPILNPASSDKITLGQLNQKLQTARSVVEWSAAMVKATYQDVVNEYSTFEPKAYSFIDDRIRSSIALQLGKAVGDLGVFIAKESAISNSVFSLSNQSSFRGLNPGYAFGELVVISENLDAVEVSSSKIYIFERAPSDLKPVAGIATVNEGNLVSHVQLLARNLGIPNAALSDENLNDLKAFNGKEVFYAVSNRGTVILKEASKMTADEKALFTKKVRNEEKILVPVKNLELKQSKIVNLREVDAKDSGKLCGPKAANLGQLKAMFPDKVIEGFVIPFGIFRAHMDQPMSGYNKSYWNFLNDTFEAAASKRKQGISEKEVENYQLRQLEILRAAIKTMPLQADFLKEIETSFQTIFGKPLGSVPVFLRSDTNMEDLKDFTGAGLNLTIFNAVIKEKILQGIRDVWASPYSERSFKWRQTYLLNPENVFPSILVIPSVDVDYSGVLITKGIVSGNDSDLTIAFSRGAGGAVDGQAAESYTIKADGSYQLIAPARESYHNTLPLTGGTGRKIATFEKPILNAKNIEDIITLSTSIRKTLAKKTKSDYKGAYDVELGFKNNELWLFQIRPFVENKHALGSAYLQSITPSINLNQEIALSTKL